MKNKQLMTEGRLEHAYREHMGCHIASSPRIQSKTAMSDQSKKGRLQKIREATPEQVLYWLRVANLSNGLCIIAGGVASFLTPATLLSMTSIAIAGYIILFGCVLFCFECRLKRMEETIRRNFGFLFSYSGRTIFILFIASLCLGTTGDNGISIWGIITGVLTFLNAMFNCFVVYSHPAFRSGAISKDGDPTAGYKSGDALAGGAALTFAQNNPELAKKAAKGAVNYAKENPEARKAAVNYAKNNPDVAISVAKTGGSDNPFGP